MASSVFIVLCAALLTSRLVLARDGGDDGQEHNNVTNTTHIEEAENNTENNTEKDSDNSNSNGGESENETEGPENQTRGSHNGAGKKEDSTDNEVENEVENETNSVSPGKSEEAQDVKDTHEKSCGARQASTAKILSHASLRGQNIINVFTTITERTEAFYVEKGNVLSNYDELLSDVATKKAAAQTALMALQNVPTFTCPVTDIKTVIGQYKSAIALQIQTLKDYKTAVQKLVEGVASVQPDDQDESEDDSTNTVSNNTVSNQTNSTNETNEVNK